MDLDMSVFVYTKLDAITLSMLGHELKDVTK
jgi:hypothetical protein